MELVDHSGDTVVTWVNSEGQNITSVGDFTITRHTMNQRVDYSLQFNPVKVLHRGLYTCEVSIPNVGYHDSRSFNLQVTPGIAKKHKKVNLYIYIYIRNEDSLHVDNLMIGVQLSDIYY